MRHSPKKWILLLLTAVFCLTAVGCGSLLEGEYYSAQSYEDELPVQEGSDVIVRSYAALKTAILSLVEGGQEERKLSFSGYTGEPGEDLPRACAELKSDNALCAYAVDYFSYDLSRIVSYYEARIFVNFRRSAEERAQLRNIGAVSRVGDALYEAMQSADTSIVLQAVGPELSTADLQDMAQAYYYSAPLDCLQLPYVSLRVYPSTGIYRIYEIDINYGSDESSRELLAEQLSEAAGVFAAAVREENDAAEGDAAALAELAAQRLAEHSAWAQSVSGYDLTAYGALIGSRASDEGLAMAYKAICDLLGLDCIVIAGRMDKAPHVWNMVRSGEDPEEHYRHVDVSQLLIDAEESGEARAQRGESEMWGRYWWDIDLYPFYGETVSAFGPQQEENEDEPAEGAPEENEEPEPGGEPEESEVGEEAPEPPEETPEPSEAPEPPDESEAGA